MNSLPQTESFSALKCEILDLSFIDILNLKAWESSPFHILSLALTAIGFLLGTRQTLLETKDGGKSWTPRSIPSAEDEDFNYRFNSISFYGKEGWIVGKPAILLHTSDAEQAGNVFLWVQGFLEHRLVMVISPTDYVNFYLLLTQVFLTIRLS